MTATPPPVRVPRVSRADFDRAYDAALAAGWDGRGAFDACCYLLANDVSAAAIVRMFDDCMRRVQ
jgi:hypothetical protein